MAQFRYECFCTLTYDSELTYEEVLDKEAALQAALQKLLEDCGGRHIDFVPINDSLQVQCAFVELEPDDFRLLCADMADLAVDGVRGRLLLVHKELDDISIVLFASGRPLMTRLALPLPEDNVCEVRFEAENIAALSAGDLAQAREKRQPAPAPQVPAPETPAHARPAFDKRGLAAGSATGGWPDRWVNPAHQDVGPTGGSAPDPVHLLEAWRDQMRRRSS